MEKNRTNWRWRDNELTLKEFYALSHTSRNEYISMLEKLPQQERSSGDDIILNQYSKSIKQVKEFLSLDND